MSATIQNNGTQTRGGRSASAYGSGIGTSAEEIFELLASANRQLGVRTNSRQFAAVAMEIRRRYPQEQDDPARHHWPVAYTEPEM